MAQRKKRAEDHPDERWLITYADMLTLMFVLFMVLFSMSVVNKGKFDQLKQSLSKAFSPGIFPGGPSVLEQGPEDTSSPVIETPPGMIQPQIPGPLGINLQTSSTQAALETSQMTQAKDRIEQAIKEAGLKDQASLRIDEEGLHIRLKADPFLFDPGSAHINAQALRLLRPIAGQVRRMPNPVDVEGHTDSTPIHTAQFPSNWVLGSGRSCAVLGVLVGYGVPAGERMKCSSAAATKPVATNATAAGRAANRRVEILVRRTQADSTTTP